MVFVRFVSGFSTPTAAIAITAAGLGFFGQRSNKLTLGNRTDRNHMDGEFEGWHDWNQRQKVAGKMLEIGRHTL